MNSKVRGKWLEAGIELGTDLGAKVVCPECGQANLEVLDVNIDDFPSETSRYIHCPICGARNVLRMLKTDKT